jgi:hypothetical protein
MTDGSKDFMEEIVARFGEDRFYHALLRFGTSRQARLACRTMTGDESSWPDKVREFSLKSVASLEELSLADRWKDGEAYEAACKAAFALSKHHKEYALKSAELPAAIHARMIIGQQNEWTRKYTEGIKEKD